MLLAVRRPVSVSAQKIHCVSFPDALSRCRRSPVPGGLPVYPEVTDNCTVSRPLKKHVAKRLHSGYPCVQRPVPAPCAPEPGPDVPHWRLFFSVLLTVPDGARICVARLLCMDIAYRIPELFLKARYRQGGLKMALQDSVVVAGLPLSFDLPALGRSLRIDSRPYSASPSCSPWRRGRRWPPR